MVHGDATQVQVVGLFVRGTSTTLGWCCSSQNRQQPLPNLGCNSGPRMEIMSGVAAVNVSRPDDPVIVDVHRLESDLQLIPFFQVVAGHDIGDLHPAASFLHVQIRA